jgi:hypothetical protein
LQIPNSGSYGKDELSNEKSFRPAKKLTLSNTGGFWTGIVSECPVIRIQCVEISDSTDETGRAADLGEHEVCATYSCFKISSMVTISTSPEQP